MCVYIQYISILLVDHGDLHQVRKRCTTPFSGVKSILYIYYSIYDTHLVKPWFNRHLVLDVLMGI